MLRNLRIVLLVLVIVGLFSVAVPITAEGNTLVMARAVDATGLDPHLQTAFTSLAALSIIYEPLVTTDNDLNLIPALATDWAFSEDGLTLTMHLRQGVKFHDGSDFNAEDVIASFTRLLDEAVGSAARTNYLSITSMDAPDEYTVVFNLSQPDVPLLAAMASTNAAI
ncbi:MAG: ABC transporter substrate-binding protein, partial [Anaerolineae bacterium]|nr:ABC transporter substrate-binding protein [Anaerolineae bacterium]